MSKVFYFTFGRAHLNSVGSSLANCYCPVRAKDETQARERMVKARGAKWAFMYPTKKEAGVQRFNLTAVPLLAIELDDNE